MWKFRGAVLAATGVCALVPTGAAMAAAGGDANAGDVWVDTVGAPAGPGHEMDPHLPCADINLWGSGLADTTGRFTIDGWPPSGKKAQDYAGVWNYSQTPTRKSGSQTIATISVTSLINAAVANGEAPVNKNGYHFKLALSQDPQKYKTFWVACTPPSTSGTSGNTSSTTSSTSGTTSSTSGTTSNTSGTTSSTSGTTTSTTSTTTGTTLSSSSKRHRRRHHRAGTRLRHVKRHHRVKHHRIASVKSATAEFTG